jgi:hypothetical protein
LTQKIPIYIREHHIAYMQIIMTVPSAIVGPNKPICVLALVTTEDLGAYEILWWNGGDPVDDDYCLERIKGLYRKEFEAITICDKPAFACVRNRGFMAYDNGSRNEPKSGPEGTRLYELFSSNWGDSYKKSDDQHKKE